MVEESRNENGGEQTGKTRQKLSSVAIIRFALLLIGSILLAVLITYSVVVSRYSAKESDASFRFRILQQYLDSVAYYDYDYDNMLDEAVRAYVNSSGDKYTVYYDAEEFKQLNDINQGNYVGIGVTVEKGEAVYQDQVKNVLRIITVRQGSPAHKAGLLRNDEILSVFTENGEVFVGDVSYTEATALIRGEVGSMVSVSVLREVSNEKICIKVDVLREELKIESVDSFVSSVDSRVGILKISGFDLTTPNALEKSMDELKNRGIERFVIDLRGNGGGNLESVIACVSFFVNENDVILSTKDKSDRETIYLAKERLHNSEYSSCDVLKADIGKYQDGSYVVLIDANTASAAELFAAVFRDYHIGMLVGEKSYGKGSMQGLYSLDWLGLEGGIRVTTKMYFPPCGESYHDIGIVPDLTVEFPKNQILGFVSEREDTQLMCAVDVLKGK